MKRFLSVCFALVCLGAPVFFAQAQQARPVDGFYGDTFAQEVNLSQTGLETSIANAINIAIGFLGIIAVILILYAGFLWMTSAGNEETVERAKKILRAGLIGLVIIVSSFIIVQFVFRMIGNAGGGAGGGNGGTGGGGLGGGGLATGRATGLSVRFVQPSGAIDNRKILVKIGFNQPLDPSFINDESVQVFRCGVDNALDGKVIAPCTEKVSPKSEGVSLLAGSDRVIGFTPASLCPSPYEAYHCFEENTEFQVRVNPSIRSIEGVKLSCGFGSKCDENYFASGSVVDLEPPTVAITYPLSGMGVSSDSCVEVSATATDNAALSHVAFFADGASDHIDPAVVAPSGNSKRASVRTACWDTGTWASGAAVALTARAYDTDTGSTLSASQQVVVRPAYCFNNVQDTEKGETGIDCGNDACGACDGGACTTAFQCKGGICNAGKCESTPVIAGVTPGEGKAGTFVTIKGRGFGVYNPTTSKVFFGDRPATAPQQCNAASSWSDSQIIVAVPDGLSQNTGVAIRVQRADGKTDTTTDGVGPLVPQSTAGLFIPNEKTFPGLCAVWSPAQAQVPEAEKKTEGLVGENVWIAGNDFGSASVGQAYFGGVPAASRSQWSSGSAVAAVPRIGFGPVDVQVSSGEGDKASYSNGVTFYVVPPDAQTLPVLVSLSPASASVGSYVTAFGQRLGAVLGKVQIFKDDNANGVLDGGELFALASMCSSTSWSDTEAVFEVPGQWNDKTAILSGSYRVQLTRSGDGALTASLPFTVTAGEPAPSICTLSPDNGPVFTFFDIKGAHLGASSDSTVSARTVVFQATTGYVEQKTHRSWDRELIETGVPQGSVSGKVFVEYLKGGLTYTSNAVPFSVGACRTDNPATPVNELTCGAGTQCCANGVCATTCQATVRSGAFRWGFSTGIIPRAPRVVEECTADTIPSPAPWIKSSGGGDACVNNLISFKFDIPVTGVSNNTVKAWKCTGSSDNGADSCAVRSAVAGGITAFSAEHAYMFEPSNNFSPDSTYLVEIIGGASGVKSLDGVSLSVNEQCIISKASAPTADVGYCFRFATRDSNALCQVGSMRVMPRTYTARDVNQVVHYQGVCRQGSDSCALISCPLTGWNWDLKNNTPQKAALEQGLRCTGNADCGLVMQGSCVDKKCVGLPNQVAQYGGGKTAGSACETSSDCSAWKHSCNISNGASVGICAGRVDARSVVALSETTVGGKDIPVQVTAELNQQTTRFSGGNTFSGSGDLFIRFDAPRIVAVWPVPACGSACPNAEVGIEFSMPVTYGSDPAGALKIYECDPALKSTLGSCKALDISENTVNQQVNTNRYTISFNKQANKKYRIEVMGGESGVVAQESRKPLSSASFNALPLGSSGGINTLYAWEFTTQSSQCVLDKVNVEVDPTSAYAIGMPYPFRGVPRSVPDTCNANGQVLDANEFVWNWNTTSTPNNLTAVTNYGQLKPSATCNAVCLRHDNSNNGTFPCSGENTKNCCGNGVVDPGEDADDPKGLAEGWISPSCLLQGSSYRYGSFCGNGVIENGEQCDEGGASSQQPVASLQYARFTGDNIPADQLVNVLTAKVGASASEKTGTATSGKTGTATFALQCGAQEGSCPSGFGRADNSCCYPRATLTLRYPQNQATQVCRNTAVIINADQRVFLPQDDQGGLFVAREKGPAGTCLATETPLVFNSGTWTQLATGSETRGVIGKIQKWLDRVAGWMWGQDAWAQATPTHCGVGLVGSISPAQEGQGSTIALAPSAILNLDTEYQVVLTGIVGLGNVPVNQPDSWIFTTGKDICILDRVGVIPQDILLWGVSINSGSPTDSARLEATALDANGNPIASISGVYDWAWSWAPLNTDVLTVTQVADSKSSANIKGKGKNGTQTVTASATITVTPALQSQVSGHGQTKTGSSVVTVLVCDNPWPDPRRKDGDQSVFPFQDKDYNLKTYYCRDGQELLPPVVGDAGIKIPPRALE